MKEFFVNLFLEHRFDTAIDNPNYFYKDDCIISFEIVNNSIKVHIKTEKPEYWIIRIFDDYSELIILGFICKYGDLKNG